MSASPRPSRLWRKHYALPAEHGAWIWWIGPLLIGAAAARAFTPDTLILALAALAAFLLRQPASIAVKALSGRRARGDLAPAAVWAALYGGAALAGGAALVLREHTQILWLAAPGLAVFAWHLMLIGRREERGQMGIELVGAGVLALAAPAAYWVSGGPAPAVGWTLWAITWLQSAASIVTVYARLAARRLEATPPPAERWRMSARGLGYNSFNLAFGLALAALGRVPWAVPAAFALMLAEAIEGAVRPPVGARPAKIGFRQLGTSIAFVILVAAAYLL